MEKRAEQEPSVAAGDKRGGVGLDKDAEAKLTPVFLIVLCILAFQLRRTLDSPDTILDIDTINFGLASAKYSLLDHQPHPPGYPGYVLYLQAFGALFGSMGPVPVAKLANIFASTLLVPAAFWVCRSLLRLVEGEGDGDRFFRPMAAALIAAVHPLLWFYGLDGQSHSAEALGTLLLLGLTIRVKSKPTLLSFLGLVFIFGLSGSVRPTLALLNAPMLLWVVWGQPLVWWASALGVGIASVALWYGPLILASGGLEVYQRATRALVDDLFVSNMSPLSKTSHLGWIQLNLWMLLASAIFALGPLIAWSRGDNPSFNYRGPRGWRLVLWSIVGMNIVFYALIFIAESGYLLGLAALSCLVPAAWSARMSGPQKVRGGLAVLLPPMLFLGGPGKVELPGSELTLWQPTFAHIVEMDVSVRHYVERTCESAQGQPMFVVTDNSVVSHTRFFPLMCPGAISGVYLHRKPYNLKLDNWLVYTPDEILSYPTEVPLELGPGVDATLPQSFAYVALGMDASEDFKAQFEGETQCEPILGTGKKGEPVWPKMPLVFDARCFPSIDLGENTLRITPISG